MASFDAKNFEFMETQGGFSTQRTPVPQYPDGVLAQITDLAAPRQVETTRDGVSETRWAFDVVWAIDDAAAKEATGLPQPTVRQGIWLDVTPNGGLDRSKGKNVDLGRLLEALGMNDPNKPFKPSMLKGQVAKIVVDHREGKDKSGSPTGETFAFVKKVLPRS